MKLKGMTFDMDGTLGDTMPLLCEAFRRIFEKYLGQSYTDEEITAFFGPTEEGIFRKLVPDRWQECMEEYYRMYEEVHDQLPGPFPGIVDALQLLKDRGVCLGVVTGKGPRSTDISLKDFQLEDYFDVVEFGSVNGTVKPRLIRKVVEKWCVPSDQVAYIGDVRSDMEAAMEAGVIPLGAAWAPTASAASLEKSNPLKVFNTVESFINWIERTVEPSSC